MPLCCEICGGRIYSEEPTVEIRTGSYCRILSKVYGGSKAVVHLDCIDFDGSEITETGKVCRELSMKVAKDEKVNSK